MQQLAGIDLSALMAEGEQMLSRWGLRVVAAIVLYIVGWSIARMVRRTLRKVFQRTDFDPTLEAFLTSLGYWAVLAFTFVAVLGAFGIQTTSIVAVLASAGLAVGLAMQGTLGNFASGFMILIFRPFKLGDFVETGGVSGTVTDLGLFSTGLDTPDNVHIIVPNGKIFGETIKNYAYNPTRRLDLGVGISYDDDIAVAVSAIEQVLAEETRLLPEPAPVIAVNGLGDSSVDLIVRPWCKREEYWVLRWELTRRLKERLEAAGCTIPYPQRDVHVHNPAA